MAYDRSFARCESPVAVKLDRLFSPGRVLAELLSPSRSGAIAGELQQDFSVGGAGAGALAGIYFYGYLDMQILTGVLADTLGTRLMAQRLCRGERPIVPAHGPALTPGLGAAHEGMRVYSAADFKRGSAVLLGFPGAGRAASSLIREIHCHNVYLQIRGRHETQGAGH